MQKRQLNDDVFTTAQEAVMRAHTLGLGYTAHVHEEASGQAVFMPGATHEAYMEHLAAQIASGDVMVELPKEDDLAGALRRVVAALIGKAGVNERAHIMKVDQEQRIAWGWASVVTVNGEPVIDLQGDIISPAEMSKAADEFMISVRTGLAMHSGTKVGEVIHSLPLTKELGEALGIASAFEGWVIAMKVYDEDVWTRVKSGELQAFSIGFYGERHDVAA